MQREEQEWVEEKVKQLLKWGGYRPTFTWSKDWCSVNLTLWQGHPQPFHWGFKEIEREVKKRFKSRIVLYTKAVPEKVINLKSNSGMGNRSWGVR